MATEAKAAPIAVPSRTGVPTSRATPDMIATTT